MNFPENLKYTKEHEWVAIDGNIATVGVTEFAQSELGDIVFIEVETVIRQINTGEKPLAAYIFTSDSIKRDLFLNQVSFGGGCVNDAIMHISNSALPFGGVGSSGIGAYHGKAGFDCFSHTKSILQKSTLIELNLKYYPHTPSKLNWVRRILKLS